MMPNESAGIASSHLRWLADDGGRFHQPERALHWQNNLYHTTTLWWSPSLKWSILQWLEEPGKPSQAGGYNWALPPE
jgi:hypothetical protein